MVDRSVVKSKVGWGVTHAIAQIINSGRLPGLCLAMLIGTIWAALAADFAMSEQDIRGELIGVPMQGNYVDGRPWDETYFPDGRISYHDLSNNWSGQWSFRGSGFCTFYNDGANGGCWLVHKVSENCYEFYSLGRNEKKFKDLPERRLVWVARGWRRSHASTCDPQVGV